LLQQLFQVLLHWLLQQQQLVEKLQLRQQLQRWTCSQGMCLLHQQKWLLLLRLQQLLLQGVHLARLVMQSFLL
jgi:hypothetical protein